MIIKQEFTFKESHSKKHRLRHEHTHPDTVNVQNVRQDKLADIYD